MNAPTNTELLFATADRALLAPYGLDAGGLTQVFGRILAHQVDFADLYFQYSRSESWSLEEGIVKSGSFNIDQGVGVRAVSGEKTAFAYSDDISLPALRSAAEATRAIARQGGQARTRVARRNEGRSLYLPEDPLASLQDPRKVALLESVERHARARDPRIKQVIASLAGEYEVMLVARSDGVMAADVRPLVRLSVQVIAEENGRREQGSAGGGGRFDYGYFTDEVLKDYVEKAVEQAIVNLGARPAPAGHHDGGARLRMARRAPARGHRARPGRRLQPQAQLGFLWSYRRARCRAGCHGGRRRYFASAPRVA